MSSINYLAVAVAAVAGVVAAAAYYGVLGRQLAAAAGSAAGDERPPAWLPVFELVKTFMLALVVAGLVEAIDLSSWTRAVLLALALWIGFPVVLLAGSVVHEKVPVRLAAIHAGDWLAKLLIVAVVVGAWR